MIIDIILGFSCLGTLILCSKVRSNSIKISSIEKIPDESEKRVFEYESRITDIKDNMTKYSKESANILKKIKKIEELANHTDLNIQKSAKKILTLEKKIENLDV